MSLTLLLLAFTFRFELQYLEVREKQYDEKIHLDLYKVRYCSWNYFFPISDNVPHVTTHKYNNFQDSSPKVPAVEHVTV